MGQDFFSFSSLIDLKRSLDDLANSSDRIYLDTNVFTPDFFDNEGNLHGMEDLQVVLSQADVFGVRRREVSDELMNYMDDYISTVSNFFTSNRNVFSIDPIVEELHGQHTYFRRKYKRWLEYRRATGSLYHIDRKGWQRRCAIFSNILNVVDSSIREGKILSISPEDYNSLLRIVAYGRKYCKGAHNNNQTDEHLICYGYMGVLNGGDGINILSDDEDISILLKHSRSYIHDLLGDKALKLSLRTFKRGVAKDLIELKS